MEWHWFIQFKKNEHGKIGKSTKKSYCYTRFAGTVLKKIKRVVFHTNTCFKIKLHSSTLTLTMSSTLSFILVVPCTRKRFEKKKRVKTSLTKVSCPLSLPE